MDKTKLNFVLDAVIGLAFALSGLTGAAFIAMRNGGYQGGRNAGFSTALLGLSRGTWSDLHTLASLVMIAGVLVHLAFHWRWILCVVRKMVPSSRKARQQTCEMGG
jgi:hypothetical protein